jgi:hypothetical protein
MVLTLFDCMQHLKAIPHECLIAVYYLPHDALLLLADLQFDQTVYDDHAAWLLVRSMSDELLWQYRVHAPL